MYKVSVIKNIKNLKSVSSVNFIVEPTGQIYLLK